MRQKTKLYQVFKSSPGLTLIEILIGMAIFVILGAIVVSMFVLFVQSEEFSVRTMFTIENANASLRTLTTELRTANTAENGAFPLEETLDQQISFYSNTDADEDIERVRYFLDGTDFKKGTIDPQGFPITYPQANEVVRIVAENIQNGPDVIFTYFNGDWPADTTNNPLSTPAPLDEVSLVKIHIRINEDPSHPESEITLEPAVQIRSLNKHL